MTITYPLQVPSHNVRAMRFQMDKVASSVTSPYTLQSQVQEHPGERWAVDIQLPPIRSRQVAEQWIAFLAALRGVIGTFEMGDPLGTAPMGSVLGTPVTASTAIRSKTLDTAGWTINETGVLLAGDYIEITVSSKKYLHKVLADVDSDGSGEATVDIWPSTRVAVPGAVSLVTADAKGTFRLVQPTQGWDANYLRVYSVEFRAVEAL